jgi:hypothetical protein
MKPNWASRRPPEVLSLSPYIVGRAKEETMNEKSSAIMTGTVEKIIKSSFASEPVNRRKRRSLRKERTTCIGRYELTTL